MERGDVMRSPGDTLLPLSRIWPVGGVGCLEGHSGSSDREEGW